MSSKPSDTIALKVAEKRQEIDSCRTQIDNLQRKLDGLLGEVRGYEDAIRLLSINMDEIAPPEPTKRRFSERPFLRKSLAPENDGRRGPRGSWRKIMPELLRLYPSAMFGLNEVAIVCELTGDDIKPATMRSQMSNYVTAGYLERVKNGHFKFTAQGSTLFSELSNKPSGLRLVTESLPTDGAQVDGGTGEQAPPKAPLARVSVGGVPR